MKLNGIIGYPVTPFSDDNTINLPVLKQMLDMLIENGCDAIAPLGSTGESAYLEWDEWCLVAKTSIESINKRVPVIIGNFRTHDGSSHQKGANRAKLRCRCTHGDSYILLEAKRPRDF